MGNQRIRIATDETNTNDNVNLDKRDNEILRLLLVGSGNRDIATKLKIPMSTVQRRTRRLFQYGIVQAKVELDYKKMGLRKGLLHVYLKDGDIQGVAQKIGRIDGMQSASIHIGNSDVIGSFVFKDASQLLNIMNQAKKIEGVDKVVWSEEVFSLPDNKEYGVLVSD